MIPVDDDGNIPGSVPVFLRIMTSVFGGFGKRGTTGLAAGSVVPGFPKVSPGLSGRVSPTEVVPVWIIGDLSAKHGEAGLEIRDGPPQH